VEHATQEEEEEDSKDQHTHHIPVKLLVYCTQ